MGKQILTNVIENLALAYPEKVAIEHNGVFLTYKDLNADSNAIAALCFQLIQKESPVIGVYMKSSALYVASIIGVNKAGSAFMPLETKYPINRLQDLLIKTIPSIILTTADLYETLLMICSEVDLKVNIVIINKTQKKLNFKLNKRQIEQESDCSLPILSGEETNYLIYTSGSTGKPKIIQGKYKSLSHFIHWEVKEFSLSSNVRVCQFAPISFDVSLRDIFVPLLSGGTLVIPEEEVKNNPEKFVHWIVNNKISLLHIVPSYFRLLIPYIQGSLKIKMSVLQHIFLAGEPLFYRDVALWREKMNTNTELINLYGPSETTLAKIFNRIGPLSEDLNEIVPLGKPISNCSIIILKNGRLCNIGEIGEILIKTPFRSGGYFKDQSLNNKNFIQNPLHNDFEDIVYTTGDLGKYLADKRIAFVGRTDEQVKIRGNRVELKEVEYYLNLLDKISQTVVVALEMEKGSYVLCAYYTTLSPVNTDLIKEHFHQYLPLYMHPTYYIELNKFPLNLNGKIDKKSLPKPEEALYANLEYVMPISKTEKKLAQIWSKVLGVSKIGVTVSFFKLGGHSLSAVQILAKIHEEFPTSISLNQFFEFPTIRKISELIDSNHQNITKEIPLVKKEEYYSASNAQKRIFLIDQQQREFSAYNMIVAFKLKGDIDPRALRNAFYSLIDRHESLRTNFIDRDGEVYQRINDTINFAFEEIDNQIQDYNQETISPFLDRMNNYVFNLEKDSLLRAELVQFSNNEYLFIFNIHHIISDGFSMSVITHEVLEFYKEAITHVENQLPTLKIQYKDYSAWLSNKTADDKEAKEYWKHILNEELSRIKLPWDFPKKAERGFEGVTHTSTLTLKQSKNVRSFCQDQEISLFVFFQAVINILLYKVSSQTELLIGTPVSGREHGQLQHQIGLFLNYLILKNTLKGESSFIKFVEKLKRTTINALRFQDYPFDKLVEEFYKETQTSSGNPFYDVLLVMNNSELNASKNDLTDLSELLNLEWVPLRHNFSKVDLTFLINDEPQIGINVEYSKHLFKSTTIVNIQNTLFRIIEECIAHPDFEIDTIINQLAGNLEKSWLKENQSLISENF